MNNEDRKAVDEIFKNTFNITEAQFDLIADDIRDSFVYKQMEFGYLLRKAGRTFIKKVVGVIK